MKKLTAFLCALICILSMTVAASGDTPREEPAYDMAYYGRLAGEKISINVFNWGEYISDGSDGSIDVNAAFEELTGIQVNYSTFATNEELYSKLKGGGAQYDIIIPSDYMIARMI